jgi:S1-C subfamily serine protease
MTGVGRASRLLLSSRLLVGGILSLAPGTPGLAGTLAPMTVQEAILRAKPAVVVVASQIGADITLSCGTRRVRVSPAPFVETGSGWFVDGRGYVVTSAHVVSPPAAPIELRKAAIQEACVDPELRARGLARGERPEVEERIRRRVSDRAAATMRIDLHASIAVYLATGRKLTARVVKFSPPLAVDATGAPLPEAGRDLALLRVEDSVYAAIDISAREGQIGDPVHILGFPALLHTHELLDRGTAAEASVTNGAISGFKQDAIGLDVIQTDASATFGTSGAPAIGNDAMLVGVMTFVSRSSTTGAPIQGFNFLVPARDVRRFLRGTDVHIGESRFNAPWADALRAFFRGDHRAAASKLAQLDALAPGLPDVKRILEVAREKETAQPQAAAGIPGGWLALGVMLAGAGIYGVSATYQGWTSRGKSAPARAGSRAGARRPRQSGS